MALTLSSCALMELLPQMPVDTKGSKEKSLYHFKSDSQIRLSTGSSLYPGMIATELNGALTFSVTSKINFTHAIIETCHRDILYDVKKELKISKTNSITYTINFLPVELSCKSAITIQMFGESGETDWALIAIRTDEDLPTRTLGVECNGVRWTFKGYTTCNHKRLKKQRIAFDVPIKNFKTRGNCNLTRLSDLEFELSPDLDECIAVFTDGKRWHTALFMPFEREFLR